MRGVDGQGRTGPLPRFSLGQFIGTGQSLSVGVRMPTSLSTTQVGQNTKIYDSDGAYLITAPKASTLSLVPLVAPQRPPNTVVAQYPGNIFGESVEIAMANEAVRLAGVFGYMRAPAIHASCTGESSTPMAGIKKGGLSNCYAAGIFECEALASGPSYGGLAAGAGFATFGVECVPVTHGETDASSGINTTLNYQSELEDLGDGYDADCRAITGQSSDVPMIFSIQTSAPAAYATRISAPAAGGWTSNGNTTAPAMLAAYLAAPTKRILSGPKYQYAYAQDDLSHLLDYRPLGEKYAQVWLANDLRRQGLGPGWSPLYPTSIVRSGVTVAIAMNVPILPSLVDGVLQFLPTALVFDTTHTAPHQAGTAFAMWASGQGFEAYDNPLTYSSTTGNGVGPIVVSFDEPHNLSNGDTYALFGATPSENTNANGVFAVTVIDSTHVSLNGTTGNGPAAQGNGFAPIGITAAVLAGATVTLTLARAPTRGLSIAYADTPDAPYGTACGGFTAGRCGMLRDSDPSVSPPPVGSGFKNYNWCVPFALPVA